MDMSNTSPLDYYVGYARDAHRANSEEHFDRLLAESGVSADASREAAKKYRQQLEVIKGIRKKLTGQRVILGLLIALIVIAAVALIVFQIAPVDIALRVIIPIVCVLVITGTLLLIFLKIRKTLKQLSELLEREDKKDDVLLAEANAILAPLYALFRESDIFRLIERVVPDIKFEDSLSSELLSEMSSRFDFTDLAGERSSATDTVSGKFTDNPFFFERYYKETMGTHTYHGSKTIHWTTTSRDSDGKMKTVHHTQTLTASVTKPKPYYSTDTLLHYGNQVAPSLKFSREAGHCEKLTERQLRDRIEDGERDLAKRERDSLTSGGYFTKLANTEFEVLFNALDRDNEQQFRMLFTPLAQTDMAKLLKSKEGYGDDFAFTKMGRHNVIKSEHSQLWQMNTHASVFYSYDIDIFRRQFIEFSETYFKSVYFDFAPLLTIPAYNMDPATSLDGLTDDKAFTRKEYEAVANRIGAQNFAHPETNSGIILKAEHVASFGATDKVNVTALSYGTAPRTDYATRLGGDGRMHTIAIPWLEYYPLERTSTIDVRRLEGVCAEDYNASRELISSLAGGGGVSFYHGLLACLNSDGSAGIDEFAKALGKKQ